MGTSAPQPRRSPCPVVFALDLLGDRWTLLVIRDLLLKNRKYYQEFLDAGEGISTNILADRLQRLVEGGLVTKSPDPEHGKRFVYRLTARGKDLTPLMLELIGWSHRHDPTTHVPAEFARRIEVDRDALVAELLARHSDS